MSPKKKTLTDYEARRLENIRRNGEMMASLMIHSKASETSSIFKLGRSAYLNSIPKSKKPKPSHSQSSIVIRRSLRTRGIPPNLSGDHSVLIDSITRTSSPNPDQIHISEVFVSKSINSSPCKIFLTMPPKKKTLTDYEAQRLENIRRNGEMMATLMIHSKVSETSSLFKLGRSAYLNSIPKSKKLKPSNSQSSIVIRRSLRTRGIPPNPSGDHSVLIDSITRTSSPKPDQIQISEVFVSKSIASDRSMIDVILAAGNCNGDEESKSNIDSKFDPRYSMKLKPVNVVKVLSDRILSVHFLPSADRSVVAVGNKLGHVGFCDFDYVDGLTGNEKNDNGIYVYAPHSAPVSGISVHPSSMNKIFTCSYDGLVRKMDVEKGTFNAIYSSENCIFSICQSPNDVNSIYIGEGAGDLIHWDERVGKAANKWSLHEDRINTLNFCPTNHPLMATSSTDKTACIWDLRTMNRRKTKQLKVVHHESSVHSAYFSPSGTYIATTSRDDRIGLISLSNLNDICMIPHNNKTGRWRSSFRAIWGWDDSFLFLGNMKRTIDVLSTESKTTTSLESSEMTSIPCRFATHHCKIGTLACASACGKVFLWTKA